MAGENTNTMVWYPKQRGPIHKPARPSPGNKMVKTPSNLKPPGTAVTKKKLKRDSST